VRSSAIPVGARHISCTAGRNGVGIHAVCGAGDIAQTVSVVRGIVAGTVAWLAGCVATNPYWDRPTAESSVDDAGDGDPYDDDDGAADGDASTAGIDDLEPTTGVGEDATSGSPNGGDTTGPPAPVCEDHQALSAGECTDIWKDKHACGLDCIDCTVRFGNDARCTEGVCEPKPEGKGG
jgi:hypothetical protein